MLQKYSKSIDEKWQKIWAESKLYSFDRNSTKQKIYLLEMFSYPSGSKLHLGHWWNYSLPDSWGRMKRMQGFNVFHPMGFDAFGLPAENYAIKTGIHPKDSTKRNIATMEEQLRQMGATFDWDYEIKTCEPDYYKWTQWLFTELYRHGLAYRKNAPVNWCPKCQTVLANEQAAGGVCERCGSVVEHKNLTQWFLKITAYADELLDGLKDIDWPEKTKRIQENWIGKSIGARVVFDVEGSDMQIPVFTTRVDTLLGVSYVVVAPESEMLAALITEEERASVEAYCAEALKQDEIARLSTVKEKTGVFTGSYAVHPLTGERVPVWVSDYVIASYGTGAVMAVPAHDERDFAFAQKFGLPVKEVITNKAKDTVLPYTEHGYLVNSGKFDGLFFDDAVQAIVKELAEKGKGEATVNYRLRDWSVSRQRYWGAPIPVVYCEDCGAVAVPVEQLPVELPYNVEFKPNGSSPLAACEEFIHTTCPKCGKPAKRETDTLDTFVCSSWYQLRYPFAQKADAPWDYEEIASFMPVDRYVGGVEHAAMHLLYARFIYKALRDMGYVKGNEPFKKLVHQGIILGADGQKMSKSLGNTVSADEYIEKYGSDVFRTYLAFGFSYVEGGPWSDEGVKAIDRFFGRIT
ncbi:MAG: leucine--tRNA ligase, partial [Clostridia bacterium]|nr:leucine--tRNA ligase [Clostridia bacterium]